MFLEYGVAAGASGVSGGNSFTSILMANQSTFLVVAGIVLVLAFFLLRAR